MSPVRSLVAVVLLAGSACQTWELTLEVSVPPGFAAAELSLVASLFAPGGQSPVEACADLDFGAATAVDLNSSLVGRVPLSAGHVLPDVPRVGRKLVLVEGVTADGVVALVGCAETGEIEGETVVAVPLTPTVALVAVGPATLDVTVPKEGPPLVAAPVIVQATDVLGRAVASADLRIHGVSGAGSATVTLTTGADGTLEVPVDVAGPGPFAIDVTARHPRGEQPTLSGFAIPERTEVAPFGTTGVRWALPARIGDGDIGYIGIVGGSLSVALPTGTDDIGLPIFGAPRALDTGTLYEPIGPVRDPVSGQGAFVVRRSDGAIVVVTADDVRLSLPPSTVVGAAGALGDMAVLGAFPVGPCVDADSSPLLLALRSPAESGLFYALLDVEAGAIAPVFEGDRREVLASLCLSRDDGRRRVLVHPGLNGGLADLGDGIPSIAAAPPALANTVSLPGAVAAGPGDDEGQSTVLVASFSGTVVLVEEVALGSTGVQTVAQYALPSTPDAMGTARLTGPDRFDDFHRLSFGSAGGEARQSLLHVVTRPAGEDRIVAASVALASCGAAPACRVLPADVDGDGIDELFVGVAARQPTEGTGAMVLRLSR